MKIEAWVYKPSDPIEPVNDDVTLQVAQTLVGGTVEVVYDGPDHTGERIQMLVNEDGNAMGLPVNIGASRRYSKLQERRYPLTELVGNVVILTGSQIWE